MFGKMRREVNQALVQNPWQAETKVSRLMGAVVMMVMMWSGIGEMLLAVLC